MLDPPTKTQIAETIFALLEARREGATICPSEVARALYQTESEWRAAMPDIRQVAAELAERGLLRVTQKGRPVDASHAKGPIRFGRPPSAS